MPERVVLWRARPLRHGDDKPFGGARHRNVRKTQEFLTGFSDFRFGTRRFFVRKLQHHAAGRHARINTRTPNGTRAAARIELLGIRNINDRVLQPLARMNRFARDDVRVAFEPKLARFAARLVIGTGDRRLEQLSKRTDIRV